MRGNFKFNKEDLKMKVDSKEFFSQLDEETIKKASKKEKEEKKKKKNKKDPFGYDFNPDDFDKKKKKNKKKSKDKDEDSKSKKDKKKSKEKKEKPEKDIPNDGKVAKKILSGIKSPALREQFKKQKVLIDNKKFWTKD